MAILKHLAVKNSNYQDALSYVIYDHDESTGKLKLDEKGKKILRKEYYIGGIDCDPYLFPEECKRVDKQFKIRYNKNSIRTHHYILSFDPADKEKGLTGEKAQQLGMELAEKMFPGHKVIVCTHTDGHNGSNNIHCHIMVHSVRTRNVEIKDYMKYPKEWEAGKKHWVSNAFLRYFKQNIMDICEREGLTQIDMISPAKDRVTNQEYEHKRHEQKKLEQDNKAVMEAGLNPRKTKYEDLKDVIKSAVREAVSKSKSFKEFQNLMLEQYKIKVKVTRGRISYLPPKRDKYIRGRMLGTDYELEAIEERIAANSKTIEDRIITEEEKRVMEDYQISPEILHYIFTRTELRLVTDLQKNIKVELNKAYARKVKISNLKEMAKTLVYVQENDFNSVEDIEICHIRIKSELSELQNTKNNLREEIREANEYIHYLGQLFANKAAYKEYQKSEDKEKYRAEHLEKIELYEEARNHIYSHYGEGNIPNINRLKEHRDELKSWKDEISGRIEIVKHREKELYIVERNIKNILNMNQQKSRNNPEL